MKVFAIASSSSGFESKIERTNLIDEPALGQEAPFAKSEGKVSGSSGAAATVGSFQRKPKSRTSDSRRDDPTPRSTVAQALKASTWLG